VSRPAPRPLGASLDELTARLAPASVLARAQQAWEHAVGPAIAASARPAAERDGVLTVLCESAVWAQELTLMQSRVLSALNGELGGEAIRELRCRTG
jgi:predicted nucleic acid-binding Zn ribbon protein